MDYLAETEDAARRAQLGSFRLEDHGDVHMVVPDFTRAMAADLEYRELPSEDPNPRDFFPFLREGSHDWHRFFETRKVVHRELLDGTVMASVTANIAEAVKLDSKTGDVIEVSGKRRKKFEVVQLLADTSLADKFHIHGAFRAEVRNLAVVDTMKAARRLQEHVRGYGGYENAEVSVGKYAGSWKAAREAVKLEASRFPPTSVTTDALFIGDKIFIYGEHGDEGWRVFGPERVAWLVRLVHRMVEATSCESVIFALGPELTILDIDVHDGFEVLCPSRVRHAGSHDDLPVLQSSRVAAELSLNARARLAEVSNACEVLSIDGVDCATAVRITAKHVLVNAHVLSEGGHLTCNGLEVAPRRTLSHDLWLAQVPGPSVAWHLRDPEVGERVVLCYRRHDKIQYGGPVRVLSASDGTLAVEKDSCMKPGVSGAAVVALSDFALLGVYDGTSLRRGLAAQFTTDMYTDVCTVSELGGPVDDLEKRGKGSVYQTMCDKGLGKMVDTAFQAVVPVYADGSHVGMGYCRAGTLFTACDPRETPLALAADAAPVEFEPASECVFEAKQRTSSFQELAVVRKAAYGEKVFVVGRDDEGEYCSSTVGKVVSLTLGAKSFQVSGLTLDGALPLYGGLILACSDGAVVGTFVDAVSSVRHGRVVECAALPDVQTKAGDQDERPEAALMSVFPFLRPGSWPEGTVSAALSHSSAVGTAFDQQVGLAMIGDSAMRTALWVKMKDDNVPAARWQTEFQLCQNNHRQAEVCHSLGLSKLLKVGGGLHPVEHSKLYSTLLEAVAGAVYLNETAEKFETFCIAVEAIKPDYQGIG